MNSCDESLPSREFARLCGLVHAQAGIRLGPEKKAMLEGRLRRRLRALHLDSWSGYCDYLFAKEGQRDELVPFINAVTTNKTDFFREPRHFELLTEKVLPELTARSAGRPLLAWSAASSTGEEPYTLAMVMAEYAEEHPGLRFSILATDICTEVLEKAELGVYSETVVEAVPGPMARKYFMRSRDPHAERVRVVPELRRVVEFRRLNLMERDYGIAEKADIVFCRNVLIYFDRETQQAVLRRLTECLQPQGYLFLGHSETLHDMGLPLAAVAPALYRRTHAA
jgi:chemotaxis protein methyltransferase CheR